MPQINVAFILKTVSLIFGIAFIFIAIFTYKEHDEMVQTKIRALHSRLSKIKKRTDKFKLTLYEIVKPISKYFRRSITLTGTPFIGKAIYLFVFSFIPIFYFLTTYYIVYYVALFNSAPANQYDEVAKVSLLACFASLVYKDRVLNHLLRIIVGTVVFYITFLIFFTFQAEVRIYLTWILILHTFNILLIYTSYKLIYFSLSLLARSKWVRGYLLLIFSLLPSLILLYLIQYNISGIHSIIDGLGLNSHLLFYLPLVISCCTIMMFIIICFFPIFPALLIAFIYSTTWLSITAPVRSLFEHEVIKRKKLLFGIGVTLIVYSFDGHMITSMLQKVLSLL